MSSQNGIKINDESEFNLVSELDAAAGIEVPLSEVKLDDVNTNIFSSEWSSGETDVKAGSPSFSASRSADGERDEFDLDDESEESGNDFDADELADGNRSNRERVESAISGEEEKKRLNPRMIKFVVAGLVGVLITGFLIVGMTGEKRKSYLSKSDPSEENQTDGSDDQNGAGATQTTDDQRDNMKFGEMTVGSDPNANYSDQNSNDSGETNTTSTASEYSTEEAKKNDPYDPYGSSSGSSSSTNTTDLSYRFTPSPGAGDANYDLKSNTTQTAISETSAERANNSSASDTSKRRKKGALTEEELDMESDEIRFGNTLRAGRGKSNSGSQSASASVNTATNKTFNPGETIDPQLRRGEKLELYLEEPIRSGIATSVTARLKKGLKNRRGRVVIPKDSLAIIKFSSVTVNGRVFNEPEAPIYIVTPDGQNYEISGGIVKDNQGFAGLTGKVKKIGGRSTLGKIGGAISRIGNIIPGAGTISNLPGELEGNSGYARNPTEIVEIAKGISFFIIIND